MLCVTGRETKVEELAHRLAGVAETYRPLGPYLQEVRLDFLDAVTDEVWSLLDRHAPELLVTYRPRRQGGAYEGAESERIACLERAAGLAIPYVDLEGDVEARDLLSVRQALEKRGDGRGRLILSWHEEAGRPTNLRGLLEELRARGADLPKLAFCVGDAADLEELAEAGGRFPGGALLIGMGPAGLLSRVRYPSFGSPWSYVFADRTWGTAPGQLSGKEARFLGLPAKACKPFLALVGGQQIRHSPGNKVYNRLFNQLGLPYYYVNIVTQDAPRTLKFLRRLGAIGASVTMPHKEAVLKIGDPDELASQARAANSVRFGPGRVATTNTDVIGIEEPLRAALRGLPRDRGALILGAGGAARAAGLACRRLGLRVTHAVRNPAHAAAGLGTGAAAARTGADPMGAAAPDRASIDIVEWEARTETPADVLINATPIGGGSASPWPDGHSLATRIVFDLALEDGGSRLLEQAASQGATCITPRTMWATQGAAQMSWFLGRPVDAATLTELAR